MDFRKSILALLALGFTSVTSAGTFMPAPACTNNPVTVPCEHSGWDLGFTAYWIIPRTDDLTLTSTSTTLSNGLAQFTNVDLDLDHKFGFGLEGSFHWGSGIDLTATWMRFNKSYDFNESTTNGTQRFEFDSVNLELGQHIDVGPNWDLRFHMGAQYMKLDDILHRVSNTTTGSVSIHNDFSRTTDYKGVGPRTGIDAAYHITDGFNLVGRGAISLLYSETSNRFTTLTYFNNVLSTLSSFNSVSDDVKVFQAGIDTKLGLSFTHSTNSGTIILEGGYASSMFINPGATVDEFFALGGGYVTLKYIS